MAKLIAPTVGCRINANKKGKVHLFKEPGLTVCRYLVHDDAKVLPLAEVPAADICGKCLGAMKAEDN